jgi:hypothetical protein
MRYGHNVPNDQFLGSQSLRSRDVHNQTGAAQQSAAKRLPITTVIASQLPPTAWHAAIGEPSVADAICDRLIHRAHKLPLRERPCATRRRGAPEQGNHASGHHRRDAAGRLARRSSLLGDPGRSRSAAAAVGRARPVENAHNAFPTRSLDAQNASTRSHQAYSLIVMERTTAVR